MFLPPHLAWTPHARHALQKQRKGPVHFTTSGKRRGETPKLFWGVRRGSSERLGPGLPGISRTRIRRLGLRGLGRGSSAPRRTSGSPTTPAGHRRDLSRRGTLPKKALRHLLFAPVAVGPTATQWKVLGVTVSSRPPVNARSSEEASPPPPHRRCGVHFLGFLGGRSVPRFFLVVLEGGANIARKDRRKRGGTSRVSRNKQ